MKNLEFEPIFRPYITATDLAAVLGKSRQEVTKRLTGVKRYGKWGYHTTEAIDALGVGDWYEMTMKARYGKEEKL